MTAKPKKVRPAPKSPTTFSLDESTLDDLDAAKVKLREITKGRLMRGQVTKTAIVEVALKIAMSDLEKLAKHMVSELAREATR